jgi:hypothetical protein
MTASWVRDQVGRGGPEVPDVEDDVDEEEGGRQRGAPELCNFYEALEAEGNNADIPMGVYDLDQLKDLGMKQGWCPYFLARRVRVRHFDKNMSPFLTVIDGVYISMRTLFTGQLCICEIKIV